MLKAFRKKNEGLFLAHVIASEFRRKRDKFHERGNLIRMLHRIATRKNKITKSEIASVVKNFLAMTVFLFGGNGLHLV